MDIRRKPVWLRKKVDPGAHREMERLLTEYNLATVCREALCPNMTECYSRRQATFLILGRECTRACTFCNVGRGNPLPPDPDEPGRIAGAVEQLALRHLVITSPTRDDLADGGAAQYAATVHALRSACPNLTIELLIPDFAGSEASLRRVLDAGPDICGHNLETVPRLYEIRGGAGYARSLSLIRSARQMAPKIPLKSGLMLGMGETEEEVLATLGDLRSAGCVYLTLGQYLSPSRGHLSVAEYLHPDYFLHLKESASALGFLHVESGPYVRSSYLADNFTGEGRGCGRKETEGVSVTSCSPDTLFS